MNGPRRLYILLVIDSFFLFPSSCPLFVDLVLSSLFLLHCSFPPFFLLLSPFFFLVGFWAPITPKQQFYFWVMGPSSKAAAVACLTIQHHPIWAQAQNFRLLWDSYPMQHMFASKPKGPGPLGLQANTCGKVPWLWTGLRRLKAPHHQKTRVAPQLNPVVRTLWEVYYRLPLPVDRRANHQYPCGGGRGWWLDCIIGGGICCWA